TLVNPDNNDLAANMNGIKKVHNLNNHSIDSIILQKSKSRESDYNSDEFGPSDLIPFRCLAKRWVEDDEVST
ncbi:21960_t:CDS:2, partial [Entrophospora sp. SA101]